MTHRYDKGRHTFVQQSVGKVCAKFKADIASRFYTRARQLLSTLT